VSDEALQRRTLRVVVASQVLGGIGVGAGIAVVGLLAYDLAGTAALSGIPATASTLGAAAAAFVIARIAARRGRRPGLVRGYLVGAAGAALAVVAAATSNFPLHVVSSLAFGWASAANLQARYAATDLAAPAGRGRALATVVWATTVGAVAGPNLTRPGAAVAGTLSVAAAHATMVGIMVMAPVHLEDHGAGLELVGVTISLHIAGMYALSPLFGRMGDRLGHRPTVLFGLAQLVMAAVLAGAASPHDVGAFQVGLVLLGTGWSACLVAGSTLLSEAVDDEVRATVQGASDLAMNLAGGLGGALAGLVLGLAGYPALAFGAIALLVGPAWLVLRLPGSAGVPSAPSPVAGSRGP
jgi:MFS family permease